MKNAMLIGLLLLAAACASVSPLRRSSPALPGDAEPWFSGSEVAAASAAEAASREAPESFDPDRPARVLSYGRRPHVYRIFFTVDHTAKVVRVVHLRRGATQRPTVDELKDE